MFEYASRRLVLASVVCAGLTNLPMALLAALGGSIGFAAMWVVMTPLAALFYALGLAVFGVPMLFLWPSAFKRGVARGLAATAIGGIAAVLVLSIRWRELPKLEFHLGDPGSELFIALCGAIAGFVWWWLNFEVAPTDDELP